MELSGESDVLSSLIDAQYNDENSCVDGEVSFSTFSVPMKYESSIISLPIDREVEEMLHKHELASEEQYFKHLHVLKTPGDGDCLLHAVSQAIWGREDTNRILRGYLSLLLSSEGISSKILALWCVEEAKRDILLGYPDARDLEMIIREFSSTASVAFGSGNYLEGIHICCLSHILKRPIICYANDSGSIGISEVLLVPLIHYYKFYIGQSLAGVYLPVLHAPSDCCKNPIAIIYTDVASPTPIKEGTETISYGLDQCAEVSSCGSHVGHFSAVVGMDASHRAVRLDRNDIEDYQNRFPLVNIDHSPLVLRYSCWDQSICEILKTPEKRRTASSLLYTCRHPSERNLMRVYLNITEERHFRASTSRGEKMHFSNCEYPTYVTSTVHDKRVDFLKAALAEKCEEAERLRRQLEVIKGSVHDLKDSIRESETLSRKSSLIERRTLHDLQSQRGNLHTGNARNSQVERTTKTPLEHLQHLNKDDESILTSKDKANIKESTLRSDGKLRSDKLVLVQGGDVITSEEAENIERAIAESLKNPEEKYVSGGNTDTRDVEAYSEYNDSNLLHNKISRESSSSYPSCSYQVASPALRSTQVPDRFSVLKESRPYVKYPSYSLSSGSRLNSYDTNTLSNSSSKHIDTQKSLHTQRSQSAGRLRSGTRVSSIARPYHYNDGDRLGPSSRLLSGPYTSSHQQYKDDYRPTSRYGSSLGSSRLSRGKDAWK